jgi:glutamyl-tRNA synthetase
MRMEDLDPPRIVPGAAEAIYEDMRWLGLDWDGESTLQSEHHERYERALEILEQAGLAYPCTCSRREIAAISSAPHGVEGLGTPYPGTCRRGPSHPDRPAAIRFRMPDPPPSFEDGIHGRVDTAEWGGDFVLRRADGLWAYQLAVVVDDAQDGMTEVVRGDDLLPSTPRQIALHRALGYEPPAFVHVPLVLGPDGKRLSKRHDSVAIADYRDAGVSPERVVGILAASLGLAKGHSVRPSDLVGELRLEDLAHAPTILHHPMI